MPFSIERAAYAAMYGPTVGDRVRLADTDLFIEVEADRTVYGEEVKFGGGKVIRDGMGQGSAGRADGAVDTVITNALIVDHWGVIKADVGLRDGRIAAIGKAGNPDTQPNVDIVVGPGTEAIAGEGRILTAGGIDAHIHWICPQQVDDALYSGVTTMLGGGTGPAEGTNATTCTPGPWHLARMLEAAEALPVNLGFYGKGNAFRADGAGRAGARRGLRPEAARGLGHHARGHRHVPVRRRRVGRRRRNPYRHPERVGLPRDHDGRVPEPHDSCVPHRRGRRRPRAGHHQALRRAQRAAVQHQSHPSVHREHRRRAPRHAHGVSSPGPEHPGGRGICGEPHSARDHRGGGHPA